MEWVQYDTNKLEFLPYGRHAAIFAEIPTPTMSVRAHSNAIVFFLLPMRWNCSAAALVYAMKDPNKVIDNKCMTLVYTEAN